jgi:hypothetical protein
VFVIATVLDHAADAACAPAPCRIGLLGLVNVGPALPAAFPAITEETQS